MKIGSIIKPTKESGYHLRSGASAYDKAVVISLDPFVITSEDSDMLWEATIKKEYFEVIGQANKTILEHCKKRLIEEQISTLNNSNHSKRKTKQPMLDVDDELKTIHQIWHKFSNWLVKTFGKDLHGDWQYMEIVGSNGKKKELKYRSFDDLELSRKLVGYGAMCKVEKFVKKHCPEIKIVGCDDIVYSNSLIILIPHPNHGITFMFIPQCTNTQNQFFLYKEHHKELVKALKEMGNVYSKDDW